MLGAVERFIRRERPRGFTELRFVGGGARSELWCQIMADVLGRRILQMEEPLLANSRGAALAALVSLGALRWEDVPGCTPVARAYEPDRTTAAIHDRHFATFVDLYRKVRRLGLSQDGPPR
jgi:xylulokinase